MRNPRLDRLAEVIMHYCAQVKKVDPVKIAIAQAALQSGPPSSKKLAAKRSRYMLTEIPSQAAAQDAEMSLTEYADFVYQAGFLHLPAPIAEWRKLYEQHQRAIEYLQSKQTLTFQVPAGCHHEGTDVTVDISDRIWLNRADGENFPDGEVDSGPRSVDGVVNLTQPVVFHGKELDGIRLQFRDGRVVEASADKNEDHLIALLDSDARARVAGEIGIGTNYQLKRFIKNTFFDEKIGGTFHLALGAGYPQTGNTNESGIHWDLVTDLRQGGSITADGELIQQNGKFLFSGWPGTETDSI